MNEQIKSCIEFEKELKKFQRELREQNLDNLKGVKLRYGWTWSSILLETQVIDMLGFDGFSSSNGNGLVSFDKRPFIKELKYVNRKYQTGAMLTHMEDDYGDDDTVHIDGFTIYVIKDFIYEFIAKNPDKLDEFFDYCKLMTRHELGHCLDYLSYLGMSRKDFLFYRRDVRARYDVQTLKRIQSMDKSRLKMTKSRTLMVDGVPKHYLMFNEFAANKKAGFTEDELKRFYEYSLVFVVM